VLPRKCATVADAPDHTSLLSFPDVEKAAVLVGSGVIDDHAEPSSAGCRAAPRAA
jgi:hypothetical protein